MEIILNLTVHCNKVTLGGDCLQHIFSNATEIKVLNVEQRTGVSYQCSIRVTKTLCGIYCTLMISSSSSNLLAFLLFFCT